MLESGLKTRTSSWYYLKWSWMSMDIFPVSFKVGGHCEQVSPMMLHFTWLIIYVSLFWFCSIAAWASKYWNPQ